MYATTNTGRNINDKKKSYSQKYRKRWENRAEFQGWLKQYPKDIEKAYCSVCNVIINAHLCDLKKHAAAKKHIAAKALVQTLKAESSQNIIHNQEVTEEEDEDSDEEDDYETTSAKWSVSAVESLIRHMKNNWDNYRNGFTKKNIVFHDISLAMAKEGFQYEEKEISRKYRNIKVRYYQILERNIAGDLNKVNKPRIKYFDALNDLLGQEEKTLTFIQQKKLEYDNVNYDIFHTEEDLDDENELYDMAVDRNPMWSEEATDLLLSLVQEFSAFDGKEIEIGGNVIWQMVSSQMVNDGFSFDKDQCRRKFMSMVHQVTQLNQQPSDDENKFSVPLWPYYTRVRGIMNAVNIIPLCSTDTMESDPKFSVRQKSSSRRKNPSATGTSMSYDSDHSTIEGNKKRKRSTTASIDNSVVRRIRSVKDAAQMWERLHAVENHLDDLADQHDLQNRTNDLLAQILGELATLSNNLSTPKSSFSRDEAITLVMPDSQ